MQESRSYPGIDSVYESLGFRVIRDDRRVTAAVHIDSGMVISSETAFLRRQVGGSLNDGLGDNRGSDDLEYVHIARGLMGEELVIPDGIVEALRNAGRGNLSRVSSGLEKVLQAPSEETVAC